MKGKITNFVINFLASPMEGTMHHMYQKSSFNSTNKERIKLTGNGNSLIIEMANTKINVQDGRCINFINNLLKSTLDSRPHNEDKPCFGLKSLAETLT